MQFDNSRLDIAVSNLRKGRYEAAFEIFFDIATIDLDQEAQFASACEKTKKEKPS
jgi:hypothetical protein